MADNNKLLIIGAGSVILAGALYFASQQFPTDEEQAAGTIAPAERYRGDQITAADVKLGDEDVAKLMQTDAFELMVKDPDFRALAMDANFQALARQPQALAVMAQHPQAFIALASEPKAMAVMAQHPQAFAALASAPQAFEAMMSHPQAMSAMAQAPEAFAALANDAAAFEALASNAQAFEALAQNPFGKSLPRCPSFSAARRQTHFHTRRNLRLA